MVLSGIWCSGPKWSAEACDSGMWRPWGWAQLKGTRQAGSKVLENSKIVARLKGARQAGSKVLEDSKIVARLSRPYKMCL